MIGSIRRSWRKLVPAAVLLAGLTACQDQDTGSSFLDLPAPEVLTADVAVSFGFGSLAAAPGEQVAVTLEAEAPEGTPLGALQGFITFDPGALRFVGQIPDEGTMVLLNDSDIDAGEMRVMAIAPYGFTGRAATFGFEVLRAGYAESMRWEGEDAASIHDVNTKLQTRFIPGPMMVDVPSASEAEVMTEADWLELMGEEGSDDIPLSPLEFNNVRYGDATQDGNVNFSDVTKIARVGLGIEECIIGTVSGSGPSTADCVAGNVVPENLPGLGDPTDAVPPGLDPAGTRTLNSSDALSVARQAVGISQNVAGQTIPQSLLCGGTVNIRDQTLCAPPSVTDISTLVPQCTGGGDVVMTDDLTLTNNTVWTLDCTLRMGDDGTQGGLLDQNGTARPANTVDAATITIEPGTRVEGTGNGALIISRAGVINSIGTANAPIVFTCVEPVGGRAPACWGGVYVAGSAVLNEADGIAPTALTNLTSIGRNNGSASANQRAAEGFGNLDLYIGGDKDDDNSGTIKYSVFAYGGKEIDANNELNNLTIGACGSGTVLDHIQVHGGSDDGLELFGGRCDATYIYATANDDDNIDFSFGYDGDMQFLVAAMHGIGDKGHEVDNTETASNYNALPRTRATLWNLTNVGSTAPGAPAKKGYNYRRGSGSILNNQYMISFVDAVDVDDTESCNQLPGGAAGTDLQFNYLVAIDNTNLTSGCTDASGFTLGDYATAQLAAGLAAGGWEERASYSGELKDPHNPVFPDFRPVGNGELGGTPPAGFDSNATYVGAVRPVGLGGNIPWYSGWTTGWQNATTQ